MAIEHDWLLENLANPDLDIFELSSLGELNTSNTLFLSKDEYLRSNLIKNRFTDANGNLQEELFNDYYNQIALKWQDFLDNDYNTGLALSVFDTGVTSSSRIKDYNFYLGNDVDAFGRPNNPNRVKKGIEGFQTISERTKSEAELGQYQKIYDPETGEFLEETPNDLALLSNPLKWVSDIVLGEPLVLAAYDEDEVDEWGIEHKKGELKYNEFGTYYYEKLGNRSALGKLVLSVGDLVTPENSSLNQIDFFDSDDLQKSTTGIIAKNIALLAPTFMGPLVAGFYYTAIIAKELAKTLPMLASWVNTFNDDYETPEWMHKLAAVGEKFSSGTSVHSKENVFTFENIANLISDVALQWGQQKKIAQTVNYFMGSKSEINRAKELAKNYYNKKAQIPSLKRMAAENDADWETSLLGQAALRKFMEPVEKLVAQKQQFGADAALMYMSLVSNYDVYNTMLEKGATNQEAALVSAASTIGMFGVDKWLGLDKLFFEEITPGSAKAVRQIANNEIKEASSKLFNNIAKEGKKDVKELFKEGLNLGKTVVKGIKDKVKNQDLGIFGKALGEGFEEVGEEFVTDLSKQLYDFGLFNSMLGYDKTIKTAGAWEAATERYAMSLLGGFIGGGLYGIRGYNYNRTLDWDMVDAIRQGKGNEIRDAIKQRLQEGSISNTNLSGTKYTLDLKNPIWLSTKNKEDSQNDIIGNKILEKIDILEAVINGNNAGKTDDQLFLNMVLRDARYLAYKNASYVTGYYDEYKSRLNKLIDAETKYLNALDTKLGSPNNSQDTQTDALKRKDENTKKQENLALLLANRDLAKQEFDQFLSGDKSLEYTRKLSFALDPQLMAAFLDLDFDKWLKEQGFSEEDLNEDFLSRNDIFLKWQEHQKLVIVNKLDDAFYSYLALEKILQLPLLMQQEFEGVYKQFNSQILKLFNNPNYDLSTFISKNPLYDYNSRLIDENGELENEEEYNNREFLSVERKLLRNKRAKELSNLVWQNYFAQFDLLLQSVDYTIDSATNRQLLQFFLKRTYDILQEIARQPYINREGDLFRNQILYSPIIGNLKADLSNLANILKDLDNRYTVSVIDAVNNIKLGINRVFPNIKRYRTSLNSASRKKVIKLLQDDNAWTPEMQKVYESYEKASEGEDSDLADSTEEVLDLMLLGVDPKYLVSEEKPVYEILKNVLLQTEGFTGPESILANELTIDQFLLMLQDDTSVVYQKLLSYDQELPLKLLTTFSQDGVFSFGKDSKIGILFDTEVDFFGGETIAKQRLAVLEYLNDVVNEFKNHPFSLFKNKLKVLLKTPIEQIFKTINKTISENPKDVVNINHILDQVYNDYVESSDLFKFKLNDTQDTLLTNAMNILNLVKAYVHSISNPIEDGSYFGHTALINDFVKLNKGVLTKDWEPLALISNDFGTSLKQEIARLLLEINTWKVISQNNVMNKARRLVRTEDAYIKLKDDLFKKLGAVLTIDDKTLYNLLEGVSKEESADLRSLIIKEQTIYNNFIKAVNDSGLSLEQFFEKTNFWKTILGNTKQGIIAQQSARLTEDMESLTDHDKAILLLTIISEDPVEYYKGLKFFVEDNPNIAPLSAQLIGSRIAQAANSKIYKAGFASLAKYCEIDDLNIATNMVHLNGAAGAGKTEVLLKAIRLKFHDLSALIIAPTTQLAVKLLNSLNENTSYSVDDLSNDNIFSKLLKDWATIKKDFDMVDTNLRNHIQSSIKGGKYTGNFPSYDTTFFTAKLVKVSGGLNTVFTLKDNIVFNSDFNQKLIFVDEAAHLTPLQLLLLEKLAQINGGTLYAANDDNQDGFESGIYMENLGPKSLFCTRTSKLLESLRSSNILKLDNDNKINAILDTWNDLQANNVELANIFLGNIANTVLNLNLRVYEGDDDINGYLFDTDINKSIKVLLKLPKDKTIGFIGDENSPVLTKLKNAGLTISSVLSAEKVPGKQHMLGLEFDYVVVDKLALPDPKKFTRYEVISFLKKFNTLATRSKEATLFIDDLAPYFGENQKDSLKSVGYDIKQLVEIFRKNFQDLLKSIEDLPVSNITLNPVANINNEESKPTATGEFTVGEPLLEDYPEYNPESTQEDIDKSLETILQEIIDNVLEVESNEDNNIFITDSDIDLMIEANLVAPNIGLEQTNVDENNEPLKYTRWLTLPEPTEGELRRNASAIFFDKPITSLKDKKKVQAALSSIQSAVLYGGTPKGDIAGFSNFGDCWQNRKMYLEFRPATKSDFFGVGSHLKPTFINVNGTRYIISVVLKLEGLRKTANSDSFDAVFDISFLNDPNELLKPEKQKLIKDNLQKKLKEGKINPSRQKSVESFCNNISTIAKEWSYFVEEVVKDNPKGTTILLSDEYYLHKSTGLHNTGYNTRLGGNFSLLDAENNVTIIREEGDQLIEELPKDYHNFEDVDNRKIVSPVYIVGKKSKSLKGKIDESIFGKAVVFVSGNTNLDPEKLAEIWLKQKDNPSTHTPEVRMVVLNNHGVSFSEFLTHRIQNLLESGKFHRMDVLGLRMFHSLWNFRASLILFNNKLEEWRKANNYTNDDVLNNILYVESMLFNNFKEDWKLNWEKILNENSDKVQTIFSSFKNVSAEDVKKLMKFNLETCVDIPIFRLGVDYTTKLVGGYVRSFDTSKSTVYSKRNTNLLAISPKYAVKYKYLVHTLLGLLTTNEAPEAATKIDLDFNPIGVRVVDSKDTNFSASTYIGNKELGKKHSIAGMIRTSDEGIKLEEKDSAGNVINEYKIDNAQFFSFIPKVLGMIANLIKKYLKDPSANKDVLTVSTISKDDVKNSVNILISPFFNEEEGLTMDNDNSFYHLLNLAFHGTVNSIEYTRSTKDTKGKARGAYLDEAFAKYGFLVDPEILISDNYEKENIRGIDGLDWTLLRCGTNKIFFDVNVEVRPGGMLLNLRKVMDKYRNKLSQPVNLPSEEISPTILENPIEETGYSIQILDEILRDDFEAEVANGNYENTEEGFNSYIEHTNDKLLDGFFNKKVSNLSERDLELLKELIKEKTGVEVTEIANGSCYLNGVELDIVYNNDDPDMIELKINNMSTLVIQENPQKVDEDFGSLDTKLDGTAITHKEAIELILKLTEQSQEATRETLLRLFNGIKTLEELKAVIKDNTDMSSPLYKIIMASRDVKLMVYMSKIKNIC